MKTKVVTVATRPDPGLDMLILSMENQAIDYAVLGQGQPWRGFGTKIILLQEYLETIKDEYTHVIFVDAYDVAFLGNMAEIERTYALNWHDQIVFSSELNCWPDAGLAESYPASTTLWKYLNSGGYMGPIKKLREVIKAFPPEYTMDDQLYFTKVLLGETPHPLLLDTECRLFQTTAFCYGDEFCYSRSRLFNNYTETMPVIIHGNGRTPMDKIYNLLNN